MKTVLVFLSVVVAALAAPQFIGQRTLTLSPPLITARKTQTIFAAPQQYTVQKSAYTLPLQYTAQRSAYNLPAKQAAAPVIVNFGLERTHPDQAELILRQTQTQDADGTYSMDVELEKGIKMSEQGFLKNAGTNAEAQTAQGSYSWVADDGQTYTVTYIADENGFQPQGAHLPTPPPIPAELERAYAIARADPDYKETDEQ